MYRQWSNLHHYSNMTNPLPCDFAPLSTTDRGTVYQCERCGRKTAPTPHKANQVHATCKAAPRLGDRTKQFIDGTAAIFGVEIKPCGGCEKRRKAMNRLG